MSNVLHVNVKSDFHIIGLSLIVYSLNMFCVKLFNDRAEYSMLFDVSHVIIPGSGWTFDVYMATVIVSR